MSNIITLKRRTNPLCEDVVREARKQALEEVLKELIKLTNKYDMDYLSILADFEEWLKSKLKEVDGK